MSKIRTKDGFAYEEVKDQNQEKEGKENDK